MYQDLVGRIAILPLFVPAVRTAAANSTSADIRPYIDSLAVVLYSAGGTGTTPTLDVRAQHSTDDITYVDVPGGAFVQVAIAPSLQTIRIDVRAIRRFFRLTAMIGGATPAFTFSAVVIGQTARI